MAPLLQAARTVPIVFGSVADPVGAGFVESLARPGGNATGFMQFEYSLSGKWLELLKEIAPGVTHAAVLRDPTITAGSVPAPNPPGIRSRSGHFVGREVEMKARTLGYICGRPQSSPMSFDDRTADR